MEIVVILVVSLCLLLIWLLRSMSNVLSDRMEWGIERAVSVAKHQGWVSPHRMITQTPLSRNEAQQILWEACNRELLYQAANGRYYIKNDKGPAL